MNNRICLENTKSKKAILEVENQHYAVYINRPVEWKISAQETVLPLPAHGRKVAFKIKHRKVKEENRSPSC